MRSRHGLSKTLVISLAALLASCDSEDPIEPDGRVALEPPFTLVLTGTASGTEGDLSINCAIDFRLMIQESSLTEEGLRWTGSHGGDVGRAVQSPDGSGIAFQAFVGGEIRVVFDRSGTQLQVITPLNIDTGNRFWDGLGLLDGMTTGTTDAEGSWSCHPIGINQNDFVDEVGVVTGSWSYTLEG